MNKNVLPKRKRKHLTYPQRCVIEALLGEGQSPYHIKQALGSELFISESTLRRMIASNELDVRLIDLKEAVKRKSRKRRNSMHNELTSPSKVGRMYKDFLCYIAENEVSVVEMDCVEGKKIHVRFLHYTL